MHFARRRARLCRADRRERGACRRLARGRARGAARMAARADRRARADYCLAAVEAMLAMGDEIPAELAWQMGRPVRYGAGELRGFAERARYMIAIAEEALAPIDPGPKERFQALDRARAARARDGRRAVELSLSHRRQFDRAGADGGQRGDPQACRADACWSASASSALSMRPGLPRGPVPEPRADPRADRRDPRERARSIRSISPARSRAAGRSRARRRAAFSASGSSSAARTPAMSAPTPISRTPSRPWSTAPSSIPASPAAASSASMSTGASTRISSRASSN